VLFVNNYHCVLHVTDICILQISRFVIFITAQGVNEAAASIQRLSIFDDDEFDIMTQDQVDTSRIHRGKR
jgi:hypothetical protein